MSSYRTDRSLLLEQPTSQLLGENLEITSIRDADWRHQKAAMVAGYNSVAEYAIDEMITMIRNLEHENEVLDARVTALEKALEELR